MRTFTLSLESPIQLLAQHCIQLRGHGHNMVTRERQYTAKPVLTGHSIQRNLC